MPVREQSLTESDARQIAWEYREKFKNSEVFEAAWHALFELRSAITPSLARRFLGEELLKYRAHLAGLQDPPLLAADLPPPQLHPDTYRCPGCYRDLLLFARDGHADECPHAGCYELEIRFREAKQRQLAKRPLPSRPPESDGDSVGFS